MFVVGVVVGAAVGAGAGPGAGGLALAVSHAGRLEPRKALAVVFVEASSWATNARFCSGEADKRGMAKALIRQGGVDRRKAQSE